MKRLAVLSALLLSSLSAQQPIHTLPLPAPLQRVDLYTLIGLDKAEYDTQKARAMQASEQKAVTETQTEHDRLKKAVDDAEAALSEALATKKINFQEKEINFQEEEKRAALRKAREPYYNFLKQRKLRAQNYFIKDTTFNSWAKSKIQAACKATRSKLLKAVEALEAEAQMYPEVRLRIDKQITELKNKLSQTAQGCSFLMNPAYREQYDLSLEWAATPEAVDQAYEKAKEAVEAKMRLAPGTKIFINELMGDLLSVVDIPGPAGKLFNQNLALTNLHVLPKPYGPDIKYYVGFSGTTEFNNFALTVNVYLVWNIYNKMRWSISVSTPQDYRITNLFPSLKALNWMIFPQGKLLLSSFNGTDAEGFSFKKGLNFLGQWDLFSGPLAFFKKLQTAAPKLDGLVFETKPIQIAGQIPKNPLLSTFSAKIPLYLGIDFTKIAKLPKTFTNVINKFTTEALHLAIKPYQRRVQEQLPELQKKLGELQMAMFDAQQNYEQVKSLQVVGSEARIEELGKVYFDAKEKYERAFAQVSRMKEVREEEIGAKEKASPSVDFGAGFAQPPTPQEAPAAVTSAIDSAQKLGFIVEAQASALLYLGTQRDPIRFIVSGWAVPPSLKYPQGFVSLSGQLQNMVEFGWLAIGNAAVVLDFDLAALDVLIWFGIPVSGFFVNGQVDLGKPGTARASLRVGGGLSISSTQAIDNVIFDVSAENIRPTDFARYIGYQLMRSQYAQKGVAKLTAQGEKIFEKVFPKGVRIPGLTLPELIFHKVWGYASLADATIGKQTYRQGLGLQLEFELMKQKAGFRIFIGERGKSLYLEGFGYGPPLSLTVKGNNLFRLYSAQDPSKGPYISWNFDPKELFQKFAPEATKLTQVQEGYERIKKDVLRGGAFGVDGVVEIPALSLKQKVLFAWSGYTIDAQFESYIAGFSIVFGITMDTLEGQITSQAVQSKLWEKNVRDYRTIAARSLLKAASEKNIDPGVAAQLRNEANRLAKAAPTKKIAIVTEIEEELSPLITEKAQAIAQLGAELAEITMQLSVFTDKQLMSERARFVSKYDALLKLSAEDTKGVKKENELKSSLDEIKKKLPPPIPGALAPTVVQDPTAKWKGLLITFGFKNMNELSKKISEQMVPGLQKAKESLLKKIAALNEKIQRWKEGTIDPRKEQEAIAARETKITQMKESCRKLSGLKRASCESSIKKQQTVLLKDKAILKIFVESKASKDIKRIAAIGLQKAKVGTALKEGAEKTLNAITATSNAIAKGIDVLKLKEVVGRYSYNDMVAFKLPLLQQFVAEINIEGKTIPVELYNLQFDFKHPISSINAIANAVSKVFIKAVQKEFLSGIPALSKLLEEGL